MFWWLDFIVLCVIAFELNLITIYHWWNIKYVNSIKFSYWIFHLISLLQQLAISRPTKKWHTIRTLISWALSCIFSMTCNWGLLGYASWWNLSFYFYEISSLNSIRHLSKECHLWFCYKYSIFCHEIMGTYDKTWFLSRFSPTTVNRIFKFTKNEWKILWWTNIPFFPSMTLSIHIT